MKVKIKIKQKLKIMYKDYQSNDSATIGAPVERKRRKRVLFPQALDLQKFETVSVS